MTDEELANTVKLALRERFPMPDGVELRVAKPMHRSRVRVWVAIATTVIAIAALAVVLARRSTTTTPPATPAYVDQLTGVTWQGALPNMTVVFTDHTVRIFDGCRDALRAATIRASVIEIGKVLAPGGVCGGNAGGPLSAVTEFDAVLYNHRVSWQRTGDILRLTNSSGLRIQLHRAGRALQVADQDWALERYNDPRGYGQEGDFRAARLRIDNGEVRASDLCGALVGSASVTAAMITFADMHSPRRSCPDSGSAKVAAVVASVLSGTVDYSIRGDQLIIDGGHRGLLVYVPD